MIAYLDCFSGVSGDMLLGAMVDAGLPIAELRAGLSSLHLGGYTIDPADALGEGFADEREDSTRVRAANVLRHGLDVALLPPLDLLDDDEPLASSEQSERVRRRDSVGPGRALGRETLDRALGEARAEAADGESDLRLIAARDQVRGLERLGCHRASLGRAPCVPPDQAAVRTSILRPSVSTVTVPSRSVRKSRSDGTSDSAVSVDGAGCP